MRNPQAPNKRKAPATKQGANQNVQETAYQITPILQADNALKKAIKLAESGVPVFLCLENKRPACEGGFKAATTDIEALKRMWNASAVLVGIPTGAISGFDVLDIDPRHGGDDWLNASRDRVPQTRIHQTKSGGVHLIFKHHAGMRNSAGKIASGVDVRADGGYIIWWPAAGLQVVNDAPLADWPEWVLETLKPAPRTPFIPDTSQIGDGDAYAAAALQRASIIVATAPEGQRNHTLNKEAWSLLRFVDEGRLRAQEIANTLAAAGLAAGLTRPEIMATLVSALRARGVA